MRRPPRPCGDEVRVMKRAVMKWVERGCEGRHSHAGMEVGRRKKLECLYPRLAGAAATRQTKLVVHYYCTHIRSSFKNAIYVSRILYIKGLVF